MGLHKFNVNKAINKLHIKNNKNKYVKNGLVILCVIVFVFTIIYFSYSKYTITNKYNVIQTIVGTFSTCSYTPNQEFNFDYTGGEQTFTSDCNGYYKLETWGAQGGTANTSYPSTGGYGGYATGIVSLTNSDTLYINVGGAGSPNNNSNTSGAIGGYNGGGNSGYVNTSNYGEIWTASGGGATHIAKASGLLKSLNNNINSILLVAGGGGGGFFP